MLIWVLLLILIPVFWFILIFNRFIRLKNMVKQAWSDIDVQLKRRHDLIPKLVETVKAYAAHEKNTLEQVINARNSCVEVSDGKAKANAEAALGLGLRKLFALAEQYPDLKANNNFLALQQQISEIENHIQMARRFYNGAVKLYNIQLESFPSLIIGKIFHYSPADYFELEAGEEKSPELSFREEAK